MREQHSCLSIMVLLLPVFVSSILYSGESLPGNQSALQTAELIIKMKVEFRSLLNTDSSF